MLTLTCRVRECLRSSSELVIPRAEQVAFAGAVQTLSVKGRSSRSTMFLHVAELRSPLAPYTSYDALAQTGYLYDDVVQAGFLASQ